MICCVADASQRLRVLQQLDAALPPCYVLTTVQALLQPVPDRAQLRQRRRRLSVGARIEPNDLASWLVEHGFERTDAVERPGEYSRRGGILDVFSADAETPFRLEFFGDEIESIRLFTPQTQRSQSEAREIEIFGMGQPAADAAPLAGHLCAYLPQGSWTVLVEPEELQEQGKHYLDRIADPRGLFSVAGVLKQLLRFPSVHVSALVSVGAVLVWLYIFFRARQSATPAGAGPLSAG